MKRKHREDEDTCNMCNRTHKHKNLICCWESGCQNATDMGTYCKDGECFESHVKIFHPDSQLINPHKNKEDLL